MPKSQLEAGVRLRRWNGQLGVGVGVGVRVGLAWEGAEGPEAPLTHCVQCVSSFRISALVPPLVK